MNNEQLQEWVELYALDVLEGEDKQKFEQELQTNDKLQKMLAEHKAFVRPVNHKASKDFVKNQLNIIKANKQNNIYNINSLLQVHLQKYWKTATVAACAALVASVLTFSIGKKTYHSQMEAQLKVVRKDLGNRINKIEKKTQIIDAKVQANIPEQPQEPGKQAGTCFVISNNGYALTNAHVVDGFSKIYVFTNDNIGHKASIAKIDDSLDLALLKIEEENFSFNNKNIPYSISTASKEMADRVFTLGYPKNSMVYSEGYISSQTGYNDDTANYQMELPSNPGVSGSPVFDNQGNIVAVINSKENISNSTTYALKSKQLKNFFKDIDSVSLPINTGLQTSNRNKLIKNLQEFVCLVKVY